MFKKKEINLRDQAQWVPMRCIGTGIEQGIKPLPQWQHYFSVCFESEVSIMAELHGRISY